MQSTISKIHESSASDGYGPLMAMFDPAPPTQEAVARSEDAVIMPIQAKGLKEGVSCYSDSTLAFEYRSGSTFIDLSKSYFAFDIDCVQTGGGRVGEGAEIIPNVAHSMFSGVQVSLNGTRVDGTSGNNYQSQAFLAALLGMTYGSAQSNSQNLALPITPIGFGDASAQVDDDAAQYSENGAQLRRIITQGNVHTGASTVSTQVMQPAVAIWHSQRLIPSNVDIRVVFTIAADTAVFWSTGSGGDPAPAAKLCILDARMVLHQVNLTQVAAAAFDMKIMRQPALYPGHRIQCELSPTFTGTTANFSGLLQGPTPAIVLAAIVPTENLTGTYATLPFTYTASDVTSAQVTWGGQSFPSSPYGSVGGLGIKNDPRLYQAYLEACGKHGGSGGAVLTAMQFHRSFPIMTFSIGPTGLSDGYDPLARGNLAVNFQLPTAPATPSQVVLFALVPSMIEIDGSHRIKTDF